MFYVDNIYIKPVEIEDLQFLLELRSDPDTWKNLGNISMPTVSNQLTWFNNLDGKSKQYFVVHRFDNSDGINERVGLIRCDEIDFINRTIRIGADVHKNFRQQGIGTKIYILLLKYCFDYLNMNRVWLLVIDDNYKAIKLYTKSGFSIDGKYRQAIYRDGKYKDYIIMSILKDEYRSLTTK